MHGALIVFGQTPEEVDVMDAARYASYVLSSNPEARVSTPRVCS